jgi:phosphoribosylanthranilate isomerase
MDIKICGLTNYEDARAALALGADFLGFVLYAKSPRGIDVACLAAICRRLPAAARKIAVFVNEDPVRVREVALELGLFAVQIHGEEEKDCFWGRPVTVWRAVRHVAGAWQPDPARWIAQRLVVDAAAPRAYGGTGQVADWKAAARLAVERPVMLAGGLTPENVAEAIKAVQPLGVDVASGVEAAPGKKDKGKIKAFIQRVREESR